MSTNANIMIMNDDQSVDVIYDHWDGYLSYLGDILYKNYTTVTKVRQLIELGDVSQVGAVTDASPLVQEFGFEPLLNSDVKSIIGDSIDNKPGSSADRLYDAIMFEQHYFTTAYHRDRGEAKSVEHYDNVWSVPSQEFNYLFIPESNGQGHWVVGYDDDTRFQSLGDALSTYVKEE